MRFRDWHDRLARFAEKVRDNPFTWGSQDCALFACDCIREMIGADPAEWFRGKYTDKDGAYHALQEFAGGALAETAEKITKDMRFEEVPPAFAQRGDVVLCWSEDGDTLGIVDLTGRNVMVQGIKGVVTQPVSIIRRAWRVD